MKKYTYFGGHNLGVGHNLGRTSWRNGFPNGEFHPFFMSRFGVINLKQPF